MYIVAAINPFGVGYGITGQNLYKRLLPVEFLQGISQLFRLNPACQPGINGGKNAGS